MQGKIALEEHFAIEGTLGGSEKLVGTATGWSDISRRLIDIHDLRLTDMDKYGIEYSILSLNAPAVQAVLDTKEAIELARIANDALAEACAKRPGRFGAFAALPMQDAGAAAVELERCVTELGFHGALVNGFTQRDISDSAIFFDLPEYRPFWAKVQELNVPFYLHPRTAVPERRQHYENHPWLVSAAWGFAVETSIHALRLVGSGLFDEFPKLKIIVGHLGEHIPYNMWRIDHRLKKLPLGYPAKKPMSAYLKENFYFTTSGNFHDTTFHLALEEMGVDHILFSVDYPFEDMVDAADWFDKTELSDEVRQKIGRGNAIDLFGLNFS